MAPDPLPTAARPVPARTVVQLRPSPDPAGTTIAAGTRLTADDAAVEFRAAAAAVVPPVTLRSVALDGDRLRLTLASPLPWSAVRLRLPDRIDTAAAPFGLRLFVATVAELRWLLERSWAVRVNGVTVDGATVRPAGFDVADAVLPADPREPEAVRLLAEWAVCPEKFQIVDLVGLSPDVYADVTDDLVIDLFDMGACPPILSDPHARRAGPPAQQVDAEPRPPGLLLGCVPAVNRRVMELPPVALTGSATVRLNVDPMADPADRRAVVDLLRVRAVRGGRTVTTYAERLTPLPAPLAARPSAAGAWSLARGPGDAAVLTLVHDRSAGVVGRTLLVTAACCRPALPAESIAWAAGVSPVTPVRDPVRPAGGDLVGDIVNDPAGLVAAVAAAFGGTPMTVTSMAAEATIATRHGPARGIDVRLTIAGPADDAWLLGHVLDTAVGTAAAVDGFTRVTIGGGPVGVPRSGKDAVEFREAGELARRSHGQQARRLNGPGHRRRGRSAKQAATLARHFAAVGWPLSTTALAGVLRHVLGLPVRVVPMDPTAVANADPIVIGTTGRRLGRGQPAWGVRVVLGPLDRRAFERFWPGTRSTRRVRELVAAALGDDVPAVVDPVLRDDARPPWRVGGGRLGRSTWIQGQGPPPKTGAAG